MATHELKTWPGPFEFVWNGTKTFELRKNDRGFLPFDTLVLREWRPRDRGCKCADCAIPDEERYTGRVVRATITYIAEKTWGLPDGLAVLAIRVDAREPSP